MTLQAFILALSTVVVGGVITVLVRDIVPFCVAYAAAVGFIFILTRWIFEEHEKPE